MGKPQVRVTPYPDTVGRLFEGIQRLLDRGSDNFIIGAAHGVQCSDDQMEIYGREIHTVIRMALPGGCLASAFNIQTISDTELECNGSWGCRTGKGYVRVGADGRLGACSLIGCTPRLNEHYTLGTVYEGFNKLVRSELCVTKAHRAQEWIEG